MFFTGTRRLLWHPLAGLLFLLALVALGIEGATLPHAHRSAAPGLFNEEHDLTNLAISRGGVTVPDVATAMAVPLVAAPLALGPLVRPVASPCFQFESRAPPATLA